MTRKDNIKALLILNNNKLRKQLEALETENERLKCELNDLKVKGGAD